MDLPFHLLHSFSSESLSLLSQVLIAGLMIVTGMLVIQLVRPWITQTTRPRNTRADRILEMVTARARRLLNESEVALFNLVHLVIRDRYLLLAKVPVRNLLHLNVDDDLAKRGVASAIRSMTIDLVLVHPGTRLPVKAIVIRKSDQCLFFSKSLDHLVQTLFCQAEIEVIRLDHDAQYSVERLTELLGLQEME